MSQYTDVEILDGIAKALQAGDMPAAAALVKMLAIQAPDKAQVIYDAVVHNKVTVTLPLRSVPS